MMGEHAIEFKAVQVGTWFVIDGQNLNEQLKAMMENGSRTKVKVKLNRNGLKLTKISALPVLRSEHNTPLNWIKQMFTDPKYPLCFFCMMRDRSGSLLKVIAVRCENEMCATGIVNYYRTLTYKRPTSMKTNENKPANGLTAINSDAKENGHGQTNGHIKEDEKVVPADEVATAETIAASATENNTETSKDIKKLAEEVDEIQQKTLKKHPATISRQEYIEAHEKVHQFATEVTKQNNRRYTVANSQVRNQPQYKYYFINNDGTLTPAVRKRTGTDNAKMLADIQRTGRTAVSRRPNKENEEVKASTLPRDNKTTSEPPADQAAPVDTPPGANKTDPAVTEPSEEPVYAQVIKKRVSTADPVNEEVKNSSEDTAEVPMVPPRMVKFDNWSVQARNGSTKKVLRSRVRPNSFHQGQVLNTYVSKPIEKVYYNTAHRVSHTKHYDGQRPRVNSNTFKDGRPLLVVHRTSLQI